MVNQERREFLKKELLKVKSEEMRVFISVKEDSSYGLMTDGKYIVYVQFAEFGNLLFRTTFEWVKSRKNGSGCCTLESGYGYKHLSKEVFSEAVGYGKTNAVRCRAELYKDFEHFLTDDTYRKSHYVEL